MCKSLRALLFMAAVAALGFTAQARELDNEKTVTTEQIQLGMSLPKTTVLRIKAGTSHAEVFHSAVALPASETSKDLLASSSFVKLDPQGRELDRDSSSSSWYFYYPNYWYPTSYSPQYYYFGYRYAYVPYYNYSYYGYRYYYYGWPYNNPYCYW